VTRRRLLLAAVSVPLVAAAVLGVEVELAGRGYDLPDRPLHLDGRVGIGVGPVVRMVWLGDSTAAGVGASLPDAALPRLVAAGLGQPVELRVLAVSGARIADVLDHQVAAVGDADVVLVSIGANDTTHLTRRDDFRRRYRAVLDRLPRQAQVVLLGVPDMGSAPRLAQPLRALAGFRGRQLATDVRSLARRDHARFVDIAGATGPAFRRDPGRYFAADHYHPSDAGYRLWADAVLAVLRTKA
jgi:lysophospholipase L1-like esterase